MKINYNVSALIANKALNQSDNTLSTISERLSTGYKINHAKDSPSGLAIAKRMNLQLRGLSNASQNASDGVSVVQTAEGALQEMQDMIHRMSELAVQSANGTYSGRERDMMQKEITELTDEITRMSESTNFNGQKLLNGDCDLKGYCDAEGVELRYISDEVPVGIYKFTSIVPVFDADGNLTDGSVSMVMDGSEGSFEPDADVSFWENELTIRQRNGFEMSFTLDPTITPTAADGSITIEVTGMGAMRMQIGANEGEIMEIRIPTVSVETMHLDKIDVTSPIAAKEALDRTKYANSYISQVRSRLGAYQNRLEHTGNSLDITHENLTGAYSRIMDTDMAEAMTEYTNYQVLTQAGTSMLAQANERPQQVLQLLQ